MPHDLTFNEADHTYAINGHRVPSVTQIIRATMPHWQADQFYKDRGTAIHKACELYDLGTLDAGSVDRRIVQRVAAWAKFRRQFPCNVLGIELMLGDPGWMFAGTIDRLLCVDDWLVVTDLKSTITPHVMVQLGGYARLIQANETWKEFGRLNQVKAMAVELREDGNYRCQAITPRELMMAERTFRSALDLHNFFTDNGMQGFSERSAHVDSGFSAEREGDHQDQWQGA